MKNLKKATMNKINSEQLEAARERDWEEGIAKIQSATGKQRFIFIFENEYGGWSSWASNGFTFGHALSVINHIRSGLSER